MRLSSGILTCEAYSFRMDMVCTHIPVLDNKQKSWCSGYNTYVFKEGVYATAVEMAVASVSFFGVVDLCGTPSVDGSVK